MGFGRWKADNQKNREMFKILSTQGTIRFDSKQISSEAGMCYAATIDLDKVPIQYRRVLSEMMRDDPWLLAHVHSISCCLGSGAKVFSPSDDQCLIFENSDINLSFKEMHLAYDTYAVEIPEKYASKMQCNFGDPSDSSRTITSLPHLAFMAIDRVSSVCVMTLCYLNGSCVSCSIALDIDGKMVCDVVSTENMKTHFEELNGQYKTVHSGMGGDGTTVRFLDVDLGEVLIMSRAMRLCLNAGIFAAHFGCDADPSSVRDRKKIIDRIDKHTEDGNHKLASSSKADLLFAPEYLEITQMIDMLPTGSGETSLGEDGKPVKPHWRRGHWRMQRYGVGLGQTKKTFIKPVFVNSHLFKGSLFDSTTSYRMSK
ncbi:MAG: hypothetical protein HC888_00595 [Candidatus Competibacteraceae bacterium]|nr:hypothetical protein [Candidatus Competibacteraceae bacterium]